MSSVSPGVRARYEPHGDQPEESDDDGGPGDDGGAPGHEAEDPGDDHHAAPTMTGAGGASEHACRLLAGGRRQPICAWNSLLAVSVHSPPGECVGRPLAGHWWAMSTPDVRRGAGRLRPWR